jgi:hypothetical protein
MGTGWPVKGLRAWAPVKTPSFVTPSAVRSVLEMAAILFTNASTSARCPGVVMRETSLWSGASTT